MAFFSKIFPTASPAMGKFSAGGNLKVVKKNVPMRKLAIVNEDKITEKKQTQKKTEPEHGKTEVEKATEPTQKKTEGSQDENMTTKKESVVDPGDPLLKLKNLAEQIRHRVHYIDKNDFAKKSISSKDKVYDFDLRKDLAYFLANDEFLLEVETGIKVEKTEADFQKFETLIAQAIADEQVEYVVYGERTYIIETQNANVERKTWSVERVAQSTKHGAQNAENEKQDRKNNLDITAPVQARTVAGLEMKNVEIFKKSAFEFVKNLEKESEADSFLTAEETKILTKIFTRRFLREIISEKMVVMVEKMSFDSEKSEDLVEFVCEAIFN